MQALSANDMVLAWETGRDQHPLDRALFLLALAFPEASTAELSVLTLGQRNARLLALRQKTFGPIASCSARCPRCEEQLEFPLDLATLRLSEPLEQETMLVAGSHRLHFRLPNSLDLAAVASIPDAAEGRQCLLERCIEQAECENQAIAAVDLPEPVILALAEAMSELDPLAEITFALHCQVCKHSWTMGFDIASFFWSEIEAQAKRLLRAVHVLARAYGWHEADILALHETRRQFYLELVSSL